MREIENICNETRKEYRGQLDKMRRICSLRVVWFASLFCGVIALWLVQYCQTSLKNFLIYELPNDLFL